MAQGDGPGLPGGAVLETENGRESRESQSLCACLCFRKEVLRAILAFAMRTASARLVSFVGCGAFADRLTIGMSGSDWDGMVAPFSSGWVAIGPVGADLRLCMLNNVRLAGSFDVSWLAAF